MKRVFFINLSLVTCSTLLALLVAEVFLRAFLPQIFEVVPPMYVEDADIGYVLRPGFEGELRRSEFQTYIHIGRTGLRGNDPRPRLPNTFRILVLGDSQAWGFGVNDDETFSSVLETTLSGHYPQWDIQVLNGGVPGYGTADQLAFLTSRGLQMTPDLVVVQFLSVNDLLENRTPARKWAKVQDGRLTSKEGVESEYKRPTLVQWLIRQKHWVKKRSHVAALVFDSLGYLAVRFNLAQMPALWGEDFTEADAELGINLLDEISRRTKGQGVRSLFLYTTGKAQILRDTYTPLASAKVVKKAADLASIPWIDASRHMQQHPDKLSLYYKKDGHWTASGHQAIAQILANEIINQQWLETGLPADSTVLLAVPQER